MENRCYQGILASCIALGSVIHHVDYWAISASYLPITGLYSQKQTILSERNFTITKSFANLNAPVLACVIRERRVRSAILAIKNGEMNGATAFDLHLSCLEERYRNENSIREIVNCTDKPMLALNYSQRYDWSTTDDTEEERVDLLMEAARAGISAVDIQGYTFDNPS